MASTITHAMKMPILMRSQTPIQGVGPLVGIFGASKPVNTPNTTLKPPAQR